MPWRAGRDAQNRARKSPAGIHSRAAGRTDDTLTAMVQVKTTIIAGNGRERQRRECHPSISSAASMRGSIKKDVEDLETAMRLSSADDHLSGFMRPLAALNNRFDRLEDRVGRIARLLDLSQRNDSDGSRGSRTASSRTSTAISRGTCLLRRRAATGTTPRTLLEKGPRGHRRRDEGQRAARARRRGVPHRHEMVVHAQGTAEGSSQQSQAQLPGHQCRRIRAGKRARTERSYATIRTS